MDTNHKLNVSNTKFKLGFDRRARVYPNVPITKEETAKPKEEEKVSS